jgi:predicted metalloprotease with PDZ domain
VTVARFPVSVPVDQWEADTRGNSILILSSDTPFSTQSVQRLHEQLRHEMFHLWFPNGVNLRGSYDWFYEGFALYQSLKLGVAVNRIRFDDYLDTLSRAYDLDRALQSKISLLDASKRRWSGFNTQVYARGMLVAFMSDLALLHHSHGKVSTTDLVRTIYRQNGSVSAERDGNEAVLEQMRAHSELKVIIDRNITGAESIDWNVLLAGAGLTAQTSATGTRLAVIEKPKGLQKTLLDKLGYNNWRKLTRK